MKQSDSRQLKKFEGDALKISHYSYAALNSMKPESCDALVNND